LKTIITQIIPTVQGEGPSVGVPVLLLRTGNCNLECSWCDTKWTNNLKVPNISEFDINNVSLPTIITDENFDNFIFYLKNTYLNNYSIRTILLTGGEPFLNKDFIGKLANYTDLKEITNIEIESNGTLLNDVNDYKLFQLCWDKSIQINISPKLDSEYYRSEKISNFENIIELFVSNYSISIKDILLKSPTSVMWKFVYSDTNKNLIETFVNSLGNLNQIYIMPLTPARSDFSSEIEFISAFRKNCYDALNFCMKTGFSLSPREHIWLFDQDNRDEFLNVKAV
jgi:organic radical activating enzyme